MSLLAGEYEICCCDLPGHGGSEATHVADLSDAADLIAHDLGRGTYIGYSLGGRTCLTIALEHPEVVERLVLIGATPGIDDDDERAARVRADRALADRLDPPDGEPLALEAFLEQWLAGPLFAHLSPEQADVAARSVNSTRGLAHSLRSMGTGTQRPTAREIHRLEMPILLLAGANDPKFAEIGATMARAIGNNATFRTVEDSGHSVPFEQPEQFVQILEDWLARHRLP